MIDGTEGDDIILGTDDGEVISGLGGDDQILGGAGHDMISGGPGADELHGGAGHDVLCGDGADTVVEGGPGTDLPCITVPGRITTDQGVPVEGAAGYARLLDDNGGDPHTPNVFGVRIAPTHGSITIDATTGRFVYTPDPDFFGTDLFLLALTKTIEPQPTAAEVAGAPGIIHDPIEGYQVIARGAWTEVEVRGVAVSPNPPDGASPTTSAAPPAPSGGAAPGSSAGGAAGSRSPAANDPGDARHTDPADAPAAPPPDEVARAPEAPDNVPTPSVALDRRPGVANTDTGSYIDAGSGIDPDGGRSELAMEPDGSNGSTAWPATIAGAGSAATLIAFVFRRRRRARP